VQDLEAQLQDIKDEVARAQTQKAQVLEAVAAQHAPAALVQHRFMMRKLRPGRELVADEALPPPPPPLVATSKQNLLWNPPSM
jgi:hypothetical protein